MVTISSFLHPTTSICVPARKRLVDENHADAAKAVIEASRHGLPARRRQCRCAAFRMTIFRTAAVAVVQVQVAVLGLELAATTGRCNLDVVGSALVVHAFLGSLALVGGLRRRWGSGSRWNEGRINAFVAGDSSVQLLRHGRNTTAGAAARGRKVAERVLCREKRRGCTTKAARGMNEVCTTLLLP